MKLLCLFVWITVFSVPVYGQGYPSDTLTTESLRQKIESYNISHPSVLLFLHTDKTLYTNNETIWFNSYLISKNKSSLESHNVLSVALIKEDNRKVYLQTKCLLESGRGGGSLLLPDTIAPGHYQLIAYTNIVDANSIPITTFTQSITIKSITEHNFFTTMKISDSIAQKNADKINVHFYPEGGNIGNGYLNTIGWETTTPDGLPISVKAILYSNGNPIDTVTTNNYGMGIFRLFANDSIKYSLRITDKNNGKDSIYLLPEVLNNVAGVHINNAVINDTLRFTINSPQTKQVKILVHNYREAYAFFTVNAQLRDQAIIVAVNEMPKGIGAITVIDNYGRPLAERIFYAHYDEKINAEIQTDKEEYNDQEKVTVKLKLTDKKGKPVQGIVSVACVEANRLEVDNKQDIESYVYLNNELGHLPVLREGRGYNDKAYLENILLIKGWRKYIWQDILKNPVDNIRKESHSLTYSGSVTSFSRQLFTSISMALINDSSLKVISTDNSGQFYLKNEDMVVKYNRMIWMLLNQQKSKDYTININDPYLGVNQKLAAETAFGMHGFNKKMQADETEFLSDFGKNITLADIIVKTQKNDNPFFVPKEAKGFNVNACGDYVCAMYGELNCTLEFHDLNKTLIPIKGNTYIKVTLNSKGWPVLRQRVTYMGCSLEENNTGKVYFLPAIYEPKLFYGADYNRPDAPQTQYLSTLFWSPAIIVNNGEAEFSFTTSNITGKFNIVVQGLSTSDILYGESSFLIKKR